MRDQAVNSIPEIDITATSPWYAIQLADLWRYRELLYFLAWRDIKVRYKQTALGIAWVLLQPLLTMILFSLIFGQLAGLPSGGVPYPLFVLAALIPWQLFAYALTQSSNSLVADQSLVTKIYFPRIVIPVSSVLAGTLDFAISFILFLILMLIYGLPFTWRLAMLPICALLALFTAISVGLWLSALNVKYRDVRYALSFLTMLWMFATPIAYSSTLIPQQWQLLYSLNPMVGVVEGFRWALLGIDYVVGPIVLVSTLVVMILLTGGLIYFKHIENSFADVI